MRVLRCAIAAAVITAVVVVFVHPLLAMMPAPNAKVRTAAALVAFTLLIIVVAGMAAAARERVAEETAPVLSPGSDRLALICTLLC